MINRMQKLHQNINFFNWNFFINTITSLFFIQATNITALRTSSIEISFPFLEWKLGVSLPPLISLKMTNYILMQRHSKIREREREKERERERKRERERDTHTHTLTNRNLFFNFKQFDHHWNLLKTLSFNTYQGFV